MSQTPPTYADAAQLVHNLPRVGVGVGVSKDVDEAAVDVDGTGSEVGSEW